MKKGLLVFASLFVGASLNAQFTQDNLPTVGSSQEMVVIDSTITNYAEIFGEGVVWDYSQAVASDTLFTTLSMLNAADTSNNGMFALSEVAYDIEGFFMSYMTSDENGKKGQGFIFNGDPLGDLGDVVAKYSDETNSLLGNYPFDFGDFVTSEFEGTVGLDFAPEPLPLEGVSMVKVDGKGTLKLFENEIENVLRYAIIDTMFVYLSEDDPTARVLITRSQYEYFKHEVSNFPLFSHTKVTFEEEMEAGLYGEFSVVLAYQGPVVSITKNELELTTLYPNPATDMLNISLPSSVESAQVTFTDALGRVVMTADVQGTTNVNVASLQKGTYFVRIAAENTFTTKAVIIK